MSCGLNRLALTEGWEMPFCLEPRANYPVAEIGRGAWQSVESLLGNQYLCFLYKQQVSI
jgi:hypothetical protein